MALMKRLTARSMLDAAALEQRIPNIIAGWVMLASLICGLRLGIAASGPVPMRPEMFTGFMTYGVVIASPAVMLGLALRWFSVSQPQPDFRLARLGRWQDVSEQEAKANPLYGPYGFMFSLLVGILLNVPVRALEFVTAIPPMPSVQPIWLKMLIGLSLADVVVFCALYTVCFAAALKRHPLFPRLLAAVWLFDFVAQWAIRSVIHIAPNMPDAVVSAASELFEGNMKKVMISIVLWLPYLLFSRRVNITYRHRVRQN